MGRLRSGVHFVSSTLVKIIAGLVIIKFLAWKLGPEGFGLLSQLMTLVAITAMFAGGGITNGLIKVLAESPAETEQGKRWISTAFTVTTIVSAVVASSLIVSSSALSNRLLQGGFTALFICLAVGQAVVGFGTLVQAEASSRGDSGLYAKINIIGTVLGAVFMAIAVSSFGFNGAAYAVALMPALTGLVSLLFLLNKRRELLPYFRFSSDLKKVRHLLSFSTLTLVGAVSVPLVQMVIRDVIGQRIGWDQVGLWQGAVKISDVYMQFIGVVLINYALPRYSAAVNLKRAIFEFKTTLIWLLVALVVGLAMLFSMRAWVIKVVFSEAFLPMTDFFVPQMLGDVFRTIAAAISFVFMARGAIRVSVAFEFAQGVCLIAMFAVLLDVAGRFAPVYAHMFTYIFLSMLMAGGLAFWVKRSQS